VALNWKGSDVERVLCDGVQHACRILDGSVTVPNYVVGHLAHKCLWLSKPEEHNKSGFERSPTILGTVMRSRACCLSSKPNV
jgi:hypothetical protein